MLKVVEMLRFIIRILGNVVALYVAFLVVPGFLITGSWVQYLAAGLILAVLNFILRPILKLISLPLILLTLGLFTLVINMLILWLLDYLLAFISIQSLMALVLGTIIVSVVNLFFSAVAKAA